jgi:Mor family transcriptional regulator
MNQKNLLYLEEKPQRAKNLGEKSLYYRHRTVERHAPKHANAYYIEEGRDLRFVIKYYQLSRKQYQKVVERHHDTD